MHPLFYDVAIEFREQDLPFDQAFLSLCCVSQQNTGDSEFKTFLLNRTTICKNESGMGKYPNEFRIVIQSSYFDLRVIQESMEEPLLY